MSESLWFLKSDEGQTKKNEVENFRKVVSEMANLISDLNSRADQKLSAAPHETPVNELMVCGLSGYWG